MGDVAIRLRVMPESADIDMKGLMDAITAVVPATARLFAMQVKPIAFGLKALIVVVIKDDKTGGGSSDVEAAFSKVKGVESVEVEEVGLI